MKSIRIPFTESELTELKQGINLSLKIKDVSVTIYNDWVSTKPDNIIEDDSNLFIGVSESDIAELLKGETFDWSYNSVNCNLYNIDI